MRHLFLPMLLISLLCVPLVHAREKRVEMDEATKKATAKALAWLATRLSRTTKEGDAFDIRWLGAIHAVLLLAALYILIRSLRPLPRWPRFLPTLAPSPFQSISFFLRTGPPFAFSLPPFLPINQLQCVSIHTGTRTKRTT